MTCGGGNLSLRTRKIGIGLAGIGIGDIAEPIILRADAHVVIQSIHVAALAAVLAPSMLDLEIAHRGE